jgi:NifU-like protein involved in Fe-S cluster formation
MASMVNELNPIRAAERIRQVLSVYRGEAPREEIRELGEMQVFQEILDKPVRLKCVLLPWRTAEKALNLFMKAHKSPNQSP